ncbi:MAG: hypothetical protein EXS15_04825 [Phycisphaerales bacterium]|nr:hypothetical protein [Phycisphaerales bacterium]
MNEFFIDLLPDDSRKIFRQRAAFRLVKLSAVLALSITTGIAINSYVALRNARAEHEVIVQLRDRASKIEELVAQSVGERGTLRGEIAIDAMLRSPVRASAIIATISHLLPEGSWLESMKVSLEEQKLTKTTVAGRPVYVILMNGIAPTSQAVQDLAGDLRNSAPFTAVTILEQRAAPKVGGGSEQHFVMRARIDPTAPANDSTVQVKPWSQSVAHASSVTEGVQR